MSAPILHPYQIDAIDGLRREVAAGKRRILLVAPTGSGKTIMAAGIIAGATAKGKKTLFLAHLRELVGQAANKLEQVGQDVGVIMAGRQPRPEAPVQVASTWSLHGRAVRSSVSELPFADVVVVDEAHHAPGRICSELIAKYPNATVIGLSATPCRGDGRGLGGIFEAMVECPSVKQLTEAGYLVPTNIFAPPPPDLSAVKVRRGEFVESDLERTMNQQPLVGDAVVQWHRHNPDRKPTVVFAVSVRHSISVRDAFAAANVVAEHIDAQTPPDERKSILERLADGRVEVLCNVGVLLEGWDCPTVECLVLARPTKSLALYRQMVGRVLRPSPGKTSALILDHAGGCYMHGLPDDDIDWSLAPDRKVQNKAHVARGNGQMPALVSCPECNAVRWQGQPCQICGWRPRRRGDAPEIIDGDLYGVERWKGAKRKDPTPAEKRSFQGQLIAIGTQRGYSRGWVAHKFKEKFGHFPAGNDTSAVEPSAEVLSWVKSRQIAYAKAQAKARGAA
ncbi:MAG: DEAD/DEAH box helicase [Alphaproteobacteria bacterium]|nr:DEAD/DEAH box helicase [Alphaproteobacteria bacterium]